ncbi:MAG: type II secretion system F family protein [Candidatus Iainarchaeum archaeon]|uniref:Type II secretion system F family protein n=1 Tax=Candidatus Iainarchaeum sp. TaxID=3101447 RepID=A0A7T9DJ24_9ARCH|nr:MAG: type II secretion system F family protein [Candidatus Diapherotrites archaeon]
MTHSYIADLHRYADELDFRCTRNGMKKGLRALVRSSVIEGASFFLIAWSAYLHFKPASVFWIGVVLGVGFIPFLLNILFQELAFERRIRKIEKQLPDSLILFASFPAHTSYEQALALLTTSTPNPIREEWARVHQLIQKNGDVSSALDKFSEGMDSLTAKRSMQILRRGYLSGIPIQGALAGMAHDLLLHHAHSQERHATLLVEKYTLLLAGGILVPVLLGVMVGVVEKLPFNLVLDNAASHQELFHAALLAIQGYLFLYAALAGAFVGLQENARWKMSVYVVVLIPLAQFAYFLGRWWMHG